MPKASYPSFFKLFATWSTASWLRELMTTLAPYSARPLAMDSPIPLLAPVTMATLFFKLNFCFTLVCIPLVLIMYYWYFVFSWLCNGLVLHWHGTTIGMQGMPTYKSGFLGSQEEIGMSHIFRGANASNRNH